VSQAERDRLLTPELPMWNEECTDVAKELFGHLDRNKDGRLTADDLRDLENTDLDHWAGPDNFFCFNETPFWSKTFRINLHHQFWTIFHPKNDVINLTDYFRPVIFDFKVI
jgi:hypothetical protein